MFLFVHSIPVEIERDIFREKMYSNIINRLI
jgi:hypothetical protein